MRVTTIERIVARVNHEGHEGKINSKNLYHRGHRGHRGLFRKSKIKTATPLAKTKNKINDKSKGKSHHGDAEARRREKRPGLSSGPARNLIEI